MGAVIKFVFSLQSSMKVFAFLFCAFSTISLFLDAYTIHAPNSLQLKFKFNGYVISFSTKNFSYFSIEKLLAATRTIFLSFPFSILVLLLLFLRFIFFLLAHKKLKYFLSIRVCMIFSRWYSVSGNIIIFPTE